MVLLKSALMPLLICSHKDVAAKLNHFNQQHIRGAKASDELCYGDHYAFHP
jgi:hypothetical protein